MGNFDVDCNACKFNLIRKTAQVIELERLEQNDSENLRDEIESPNVVRALRPASTASSETQTARRRDARRTQDGRRPYADVAQDGHTREATANCCVYKSLEFFSYK